MASKIKDKLEQTRRKLAQAFQVQEIERLSALAKAAENYLAQHRKDAARKPDSSGESTLKK